MNSIALRLNQKLSSRRFGFFLFSALAVGTLGIFGVSRLPVTRLVPRQTPIVSPVIHSTAQPITFRATRVGEVKLNGALSQSKFVQGSDGITYVNLTLESPSAETALPVRRPMDMIVVLDHSGSMIEANRLPYAKAAISELVSRLNTNDRFALVAFDSSANILFPLTSVTAAERERLNQIVNSITPGSGTNLSSGLQLASNLELGQSSERVRQLLILSDGQANEGISDPTRLGQMARGYSESGLVVSTIGMGLGFNEALMAGLAENGMGSYAYLENLAGLGDILNKDLQGARNMYAQKSELHIQPGNGVVLIDAAGYPIENHAGEFVVPTGQLFGGQKRTLTLTLKNPTGALGVRALANVSLVYSVGDEVLGAEVDGNLLNVEVVPPARTSEALASVSPAVLKDVSNYNEFGRMEKNFWSGLNSGDKIAAKRALDEYRGQVQQLEGQTGLKIMEATTAQKLSQLDSSLDDAFNGTFAEQSVKRNRLGKFAHAEGKLNQQSR